MNESDWIRQYIAPLVTAPGASGLRDDVALLSIDGPTVATMDTLVEGVHFLRADPVDTVGQKLIRVNVSDILAKGARPSEALLSIAWPKNRSESEFSALLSGVARDLRELGVSLIGGDLVRTDGPLTVTLSLTGTCIGDGPVRRAGGAPEHALWISGEIGWGALGLEAAQSGVDPDIADRYHVPRIARMDAADIVARLASASVDVSDGLLIDASRLAAASECGVVIDLEAVPLAAPSPDLASILAQCTAGDDYQILMSAPPETRIDGFSKIGFLTESGGLQLRHRGQPVNAPSILGFEHKA